MTEEFDPIVEIIRLAYRRGREIQRQRQAASTPSDEKVELTGATTNTDLTATTALLLQTEQAAIDLVINSLTSEHSKRAYTKALNDFFAWREANKKPFVKATVQEYRQTLTGSPASINLKLSAVRKLAKEAADNGLLDPTIAGGIQHVSGVSAHGVRSGNWLTKQQAQDILIAPDITTLKGLRDRAALAVMIGGGRECPKGWAKIGQ